MEPFGYVPVEEYLFFIGQTFLVGIALLTAARLAPSLDRPFLPRMRLRLWSTLLAISIWIYGVFLLGFGNVSGTYLGLELAWGMIPLTVQLGFGADIIWYYRRPVFWTLLPSTVYLSLADALAIKSGTWTISPEQSLGITWWNPASRGIRLLFLDNSHGSLWRDTSNSQAESRSGRMDPCKIAEFDMNRISSPRFFVLALALLLAVFAASSAMAHQPFFEEPDSTCGANVCQGPRDFDSSYSTLTGDDIDYFSFSVRRDRR